MGASYTFPHSLSCVSGSWAQGHVKLPNRRRFESQLAGAITNLLKREGNRSRDSTRRAATGFFVGRTVDPGVLATNDWRSVMSVLRFREPVSTPSGSRSVQPHLVERLMAAVYRRESMPGFLSREGTVPGETLLTFCGLPLFDRRDYRLAPMAVLWPVPRDWRCTHQSTVFASDRASVRRSISPSRRAHSAR
jgi:hypothetical protein